MSAFAEFYCYYYAHPDRGYENDASSSETNLFLQPEMGSDVPGEHDGTVCIHVLIPSEKQEDIDEAYKNLPSKEEILHLFPSIDRLDSDWIFFETTPYDY